MTAYPYSATPAGILRADFGGGGGSSGGGGGGGGGPVRRKLRYYDETDPRIRALARDTGRRKVGGTRAAAGAPRATVALKPIRRIAPGSVQPAGALTLKPMPAKARETAFQPAPGTYLRRKAAPVAIARASKLGLPGLAALIAPVDDDTGLSGIGYQSPGDYFADPGPGLGFLKKIGKAVSKVTKAVGSGASWVVRTAAPVLSAVAAPVTSAIAPLAAPIAGAAVGGNPLTDWLARTLNRNKHTLASFGIDAGQVSASIAPPPPSPQLPAGYVAPPAAAGGDRRILGMSPAAAAAVGVGGLALLIILTRRR